MNSFRTGLWKTRGTSKANALSRNIRELTCLNRLEKLISLIAKLLPVEIDSNDLVYIKQQEDESLKDYIQRVLEAAAKTKSLSEDARVMALEAGLKEMIPLWSNFHLKAVYIMNDFLDRVNGFIKLEEAVT
uniref:Uncharacterized protein n=1 Tax=Cannabis sativa TaxID=3483 RepID=A0A803PC42_CANSA